MSSGGGYTINLQLDPFGLEVSFVHILPHLTCSSSPGRLVLVLDLRLIVSLFLGDNAECYLGSLIGDTYL